VIECVDRRRVADHQPIRTLEHLLAYEGGSTLQQLERAAHRRSLAERGVAQGLNGRGDASVVAVDFLAQEFQCLGARGGTGLRERIPRRAERAGAPGEANEHGQEQGSGAEQTPFFGQTHTYPYAPIGLIGINIWGVSRRVKRKSLPLNYSVCSSSAPGALTTITVTLSSPPWALA
jgi:hypothetical protein